MQIRHQIDLMDMGQKGAVKFNGSSYRYVLSVMDVFSRFVWLLPINKKMCKNVADELRSIYLDLPGSFSVIKGASSKEPSRSFAASWE